MIITNNLFKKKRTEDIDEYTNTVNWQGVANNFMILHTTKVDNTNRKVES